jgi:hypothetical protein
MQTDQFLSRAELDAMTLQVGLVGFDGVVIASDRRLVVYEGKSRSSSQISKICTSDSVTCCWAGDDLSEWAAQSVIKRPWTRDACQSEAFMVTELSKNGCEDWKEYTRQRGEPVAMSRVVMVAVHANASLWRLDVGPRSNARRHFDRLVTGDPGNTARHFVNKYAANCCNEPVARLITLAAYAIIVGGEENPHGVDGLEVAVIPKNGTTIKLTESQERELYQRASVISQKARDGLLEPFQY